MYEITPQHEFLVGIDSDGCAFDTMEVKHKECFIPAIVQHYGLAGVSKYAREAAEFVNLYSKSRGINRFPALIEALEWLRDRAEVKARGVEIRIPQSLADWIKRETKLGNPALEAAVKQSGDAESAHGAGMVQGGQRGGGARRAQRAPLPFRARVPGKARAPGRLVRRLGHAERSAAPRVGRARPG